MPKHLSNLKHVYQKTYEELKNPKSPIGIFLAKIDRYEVEGTDAIKDAIKEFIKVYETEENNFVMPDPNEEVVSYKAEQERLKVNMDVERKLEEAINKMQGALDLFAMKNLEGKKTPSQEEIAKMDDIRDKIKAQRDRVLNAAYKIELADEQEMINKLKANYELFDHRPEESKVEIPPEIYNSAPYKFRNMPRKGGLEVPTALYGLMRFTDLLSDHEKRMKEALRSREYERFVTDRLMGYQAWQNTLVKEQELYQEITNKLEPDFLTEYNTYMSNVPLNSTFAGCYQFLSNKYVKILEIKDKIEALEKINEDYKREYKDREADYYELIDNLKQQEDAINNALNEAENNEYLAEGFEENNEKTRSSLEIELGELENQLNNVNTEIKLLAEEQITARNAMVERANQVLHYSVELDNLQDALKLQPQKALDKFLADYNDGVAHLDNELNTQLEIIKEGNHALKVNNEKFLQAERDFNNYSKEINTRKKELDLLLKGHNDLKDLAEEDFKKESGVAGFFKRNNIFNKKSRQEHQQKYDNAKAELAEQKQMVADLEKAIEENTKLRDDSQTAMDAYKNAWNGIMNNLVASIQNSAVYSKDLKEKLDLQKAEFEKANQEYDDKVKEINEDVVEQKQGTQDILDKTTFGLDKFNAQMIMKNDLKKNILVKLESVKERIKNCNHTRELINNAKDSLESLKKQKAEFDISKEKQLKEAKEDLEHCQYRVNHGLEDLQNTINEHGAQLEGYRVLKEYLDQGKATSNRVLTDLQAIMTKSLEISMKESTEQKEYIQNRENDLMKSFADKMLNKNAFADRSKVMGADNEIDGSVFSYMKQISALKSSNSKEFKRLENAVFAVFDENGNFKLDADLKKALASENDREQTMKDIRAQIQEIADAAKAYEKAKGSASRFTETGKLRYRFADEMRSITSTMLEDFALWDTEKEWTTKLINMDDKDLYVNKNISFYQTESHKMTQSTFVGKNEVNNLDAFAKAVYEEQKKKEKEEANKEANKEEPVLEDDDLHLDEFFK